MARIFISHRGIDAAPALRLACELRDRGQSVWLDEWEINLGDSIIERIDSGLKGADFLLLCCSGFGVDAPWMSREWMSALARQLNGHHLRIIPVLFDGGEVPSILSDIKCVNLFEDWHGGILQICVALGR